MGYFAVGFLLGFLLWVLFCGVFILTLLETAVISLFDFWPFRTTFLAPNRDCRQTTASELWYPTALRDPWYGGLTQLRRQLLAELYGPAGTQQHTRRTPCRRHCTPGNFHSNRYIFGSFVPPEGISVKTEVLDTSGIRWEQNRHAGVRNEILTSRAGYDLVGQTYNPVGKTYSFWGSFSTICETI